MEIEVNTKKKVNITRIKTHIKVCDRFTASVYDESGNEVLDYDGYVPDFFPEQHFGDYLYLDIDLETGQILNWKKPSASQISALINVEED